MLGQSWILFDILKWNKFDFLNQLLAINNSSMVSPQEVNNCIEKVFLRLHNFKTLPRKSSDARKLWALGCTVNVSGNGSSRFTHKLGNTRQVNMRMALVVRKTTVWFPSTCRYNKAIYFPFIEFNTVFSISYSIQFTLINLQDEYCLMIATHGRHQYDVISVRFFRLCWPTMMMIGDYKPNQIKQWDWC